MATAPVTINNIDQKSRDRLVLGSPSSNINIEAEGQRYRIEVTSDGGLRITSLSFDHTNLIVKPVVSNVITVKGVAE